MRRCHIGATACRAEESEACEGIGRTGMTARRAMAKEKEGRSGCAGLLGRMGMQGAWGMTLVEVLVAVLLLGLALGAGLRAITVQRRVGEAVRRRTEALHTCRQVLEQLTQLSFHHANVQDGTHGIPGGGRYRVTRVPPSDAFSSLKQIEVTVPWPGGDPGTGGAANETLTVVISEALHP